MVWFNLSLSCGRILLHEEPQAGDARLTGLNFTHPWDKAYFNRLFSGFNESILNYTAIWTGKIPYLKLSPMRTEPMQKNIITSSSSHPSVLTAGSLFLSSSLSSARSALKPFSWAALYSGLKTSSSLRLTKHAVWYQRSIRPSCGFSGSTVFLETRIWSWGRRQRITESVTQRNSPIKLAWHQICMSYWTHW